MNIWIGVGRLVRDPNVNFTNSGKCVTRFSIAINTKKKDKEYTEFVSCEAWNATAKTIAEHCEKGDQLIILGHLHTRDYEKNGEKRFYTYIVVSRMKFGAKRLEQKNMRDSGLQQPMPSLLEAVWGDDIPPAKDEDFPSEDDIPF